MSKEAKKTPLQRCGALNRGSNRRRAGSAKTARHVVRAAQKAGTPLREIGEAAGLHWSNAAEALRKK
jgi:hypothetical protein